MHKQFVGYLKKNVYNRFANTPIGHVKNKLYQKLAFQIRPWEMSHKALLIHKL